MFVSLRAAVLCGTVRTRRGASHHLIMIITGTAIETSSMSSVASGIVDNRA